VPTCRWRCRCSLLPHCPPDTSRTGALQAFNLSPRRHARQRPEPAGVCYAPPPARAARACWISSARRVREGGRARLVK